MTQIYNDLGDIREIAKGLELAGDVGVADKFRLPMPRNYTSVIAAAHSFVTNATPMAAAFTERGMPATFIADLDAKITAFNAATDGKNGGKTGRVGGTAALDASADAGLKVVQQLRGSMRVHLRSKPDLLAGWRSASRVVRSAPQPAQTGGTPAEPTPPAPPSGS